VTNSGQLAIKTSKAWMMNVMLSLISCQNIVCDTSGQLAVIASKAWMMNVML